MKGLPGYFIGIILLVFLALLGTSLITASLGAEQARDFHTTAVSQIENSNFNAEVIESLYLEANRLGYYLEPIEIQEVIPDKKMCEVILHYEVPMGIFRSAKETHEIRGYAR